MKKHDEPCGCCGPRSRALVILQPLDTTVPEVTPPGESPPAPDGPKEEKAPPRGWDCIS
jgi:hypothetical protein